MKKLICVVAAMTFIAAPASSAAVHAAPAEQGKVIFTRFDAWGLSPNADIWSVDSDGNGLTKLTDAVGYEGNGAWSPNGEKIAFDSDEHGNYDIFVMNPDGTGQKRLTRSKVGELWPKWSPDGRRIAYAKGTELWVMDSDGSDRQRIYASRGEPITLDDWSPNGRWITFTVGCYCPSQVDWDILVIRPNGSGLKKLVATDEDEGGMTWSPDGRWIAFTRLVGCNASSGCHFDIFTARADGSGEKNLTNDPTSWDTTPGWSPDARKIVYSRWGSSELDVDIFVMDRDGGDPRRLALTPDAIDFWPDWQPTR